LIVWVLGMCSYGWDMRLDGTYCLDRIVERNATMREIHTTLYIN
jgi:hypothetical protein